MPALIVAIVLTSLQLLEPPPPNRRQRRAHLQPKGTPPPPPAQPATALKPAAVAGVREDHSFEQYFFDEPTRDALLDLLSPFEVCEAGLLGPDA